MATFRLRSPRYCSVLPAVGVSRIFDKQLAAKQKSWFPDVALANSSGKITQPALRFSTLHPSGRGPRDKRRGEAEISFHTGSITSRFLWFSVVSMSLYIRLRVSPVSRPDRSSHQRSFFRFLQAKPRSIYLSLGMPSLSLPIRIQSIP